MSDEIIPLLYRLDGKLDSLTEEVRRHFQDDKEDFADIRGSLKAVEKKTWWLTGIVASIGFITGKLTGKF